ncbi:hypothetical protein ND808_15410 [Streptomyces sp. DR7-3]|uniref:hypothetical protein n=1 Tax=Streptomyces malaysiensis TaxID=92644 RepID=UPI00204307D6|nr:hypothetical protein [Streptomyces sp. DR7-3]MCM3807249.1 hypothetical protein [Streptomyces sp. DR7-3]
MTRAAPSDVGRWGWMTGIGSAEAWAALAVWAATLIGMLAAAAALRRTADPGTSGRRRRRIGARY